MRFANEFVRHKTLDLMGDLYVGGPILGRVITFKGGHKLNHALLVALYSSARFVEVYKSLIKPTII